MMLWNQAQVNIQVGGGHSPRYEVMFSGLVLWILIGSLSALLPEMVISMNMMLGVMSAWSVVLLKVEVISVSKFTSEFETA